MFFGLLLLFDLRVLKLSINAANTIFNTASLVHWHVQSGVKGVQCCWWVTDFPRNKKERSTGLHYLKFLPGPWLNWENIFGETMKSSNFILKGYLRLPCVNSNVSWVLIFNCRAHGLRGLFWFVLEIEHKAYLIISWIFWQTNMFLNFRWWEVSVSLIFIIALPEFMRKTSCLEALQHPEPVTILFMHVKNGLYKIVKQ